MIFNHYLDCYEMVYWHYWLSYYFLNCLSHLLNFLVHKVYQQLLLYFSFLVMILSQLVSSTFVFFLPHLNLSYTFQLHILKYITHHADSMIKSFQITFLKLIFFELLALTYLNFLSLLLLLVVYTKNTLIEKKVHFFFAF